MRTVVDSVLADARFAVRALRRAPGFTVVSLATLTIGIVIVTTMFSLINSFYFHPLPYPDASRVVALSEASGQFSAYTAVSPTAARAILANARSFERIVTYETAGGAASVGGEARQLGALRIDTGFAALFGLPAQIGRLLGPDDIRAELPNVVISDVLWRSGFGADPTV